MIFNKSKYNEEWDTLLLSKLGTFNRGKSKHRPRNDKRLFEDGEYPLVQTGDIREANLFISEHTACYNEFGLSQSKLWPKNTLCITIAANIAETALLDYPMCFPDSIVGFNAFEGKTTEEFIHYVFTYIKQAIQNSVQGSIQDNINLGYLSKLKIKTPKFSEQKRITNVLKILDKKIELNKKINEKLEAMAKLIYDYWFVQFDFPNENGKPYKSTGGKMVFNEELNREIPEGWEVGSLVDIADYTNGIACQKYPPKESGDYLKVIKIKEMREGFTENSDKVRANVPDKIKISDGDILFSWSASLEVMIWTGGQGALNQHIFKVTSGKYPKSFYFFELVNYLNHFKMMADLRKTTMGHITKGHLEQSRIAIPPLEKIQELDKILSPYFKLIVKNDQEIRRLEAIRDWLLPMLMNGQVTVAEAEQEVSKAAEGETEYETAETETEKATIIPFPQRRKINSEIKKIPGISTIDTQAGSMCRIFVLYDNHDGPKEHFGRTKTEKANHIIESHAKVDMGRMPQRMRHGAADFQRLVNKVEYKAAKRGWFNATEINDVVYYRKGTRFNEPYQKLDQKLGVKKDEVDRIIKLFIPLTTHEAEVRQTVYAAWHDLIAYGQNPTNDQIVEWSSTEKYWTEEKEEIPKQDFFEAIKWLKNNNLVPDGKGKITVKGSL